MSNEGGTFLCTEIQVLSGLEAIRKRPAMYFDQKKPLSLVEPALQDLVEQNITSRAQVTLIGRFGEIRLPVALGLEKRPSGERLIETIVSTVPTHHFWFSVLNAASEWFDIQVEGDERVSLTYRKGVLDRKVEDRGSGKTFTIIQFTLDPTLVLAGFPKDAVSKLNVPGLEILSE